MKRNTKINALLLLAVAALAVLPLALGLGDHKEEPFTGADAEAETAITEIEPDYEPWFSPLYEPPSGEIESALFALQAALGAGVLAYYFGIHRGRRQGEARARALLDASEAADTAPARPLDAAVTTTPANAAVAASTATASGDDGSAGGSGESPAGRG
ncbi:energy-coupling factor ABC transporter substrate-binding protein [Streptomyces deccanensis]|uniref:energy-coupling factor ABC transporter substrate-binding protein n=1 Tax=Streptomyces deccanensis TaxID=424188 RepID=UPI001EFA795E|nr:energy-coupling factor ABC transporter substrate-binding protein [Streptomyces deccanensis]ULR48352.1 energy-coupling factor ABC transporter substrate-binding protein [Streptomyces deccanensis]